MAEDTDIDQEIAAVERDLEGRNLLKADLCSALGISSQTYNNWRTRGIPKGKRLAVARFMGWDPVSFMDGRIQRGEPTGINAGGEYGHQVSPGAFIAEPTEGALADEQEMLTIFRQLNHDDRGRLLDFGKRLAMTALPAEGREIRLPHQNAAEQTTKPTKKGVKKTGS